MVLAFSLASMYNFCKKEDFLPLLLLTQRREIFPYWFFAVTYP